jgi:aminopeptidase N
MTDVDKHTLSNYLQAEVTSAKFDWSIDFSASSLSGTVEYTFKVHQTTSTVVLDTSHLEISGAHLPGADDEAGKLKLHHSILVYF